MTALQRPAGAEDFDFLWGSWTVVNERLVSRLTGSDEWEQFEARGDCRPILGGIGNVDTLKATWRGTPFEGMSLRLFSLATGLWSIYWSDTVTGELFPPLVGRFTNGVGTFYGDDQHDGRPVRVRFIWSEITPTSARWEQAFSPDQGQTWETNWVMSFARRAEDAAR